MERKKFLLILPILVVAISPASISAAIVAYSSDFSNSGTGADSIDGWVASSVNTTLPTLSRSTDPDDSTNGDGVQGDGALFINNMDSVADDTASYVLGGTLEEGETITINFTVFNGAKPGSGANVELYDVTAGAVLGFADAGLAGNQTFADGTITYTGLLADAGHTLRIDIRETSANSAGRDRWLDYITVETTAVPEPSSLALTGLGFAALLIRRRR